MAIKRIAGYAGLFLAVLIICTSLLWVSTRLPQEKIDLHVARSADILESEGQYAYILDGRKSSMLDNYTDSIILTVCKTSSPNEPLSFLTNPIFDGDTPLDSLVRYCRDGAEPDGHYVRYWLGFRIFLRPLLEFLDFRGIRYASIALMLLLLVAVFVSVTKNVSLCAGIAFGISMALIRPYVAARCMQFACCPMIALTAMMLVPFIEERRKLRLSFFMVVGMLTMFFDFYTVPVLTFGLPMVYCMAVRLRKGRRITLRDMLGCFALWLAGYLCMWLTKLALTSLFTPYDGFSNGIKELLLWLDKRNGAEQGQFSVLRAFGAVYAIICPDMLSKIVMAGLAAAFAVLVVMRVRSGYSHGLISALPIAAVGFLPVIWFAASAKPIVSHAFFQYRSIAVLYWALGAWVAVSNRDPATADSEASLIK